MGAGSFLGTQAPSVPATLAFTAPTRPFAAIFVALGVVHARRMTAVETCGQFEEVWAMPGEVQVRYQLNGQEKRGTVVERTQRDGRRYLGIVEGKSGKTLLPEQLAHDLVVQQGGATRRSRSLTITDPWLARMLDGCDPQQYLFNDRYDCLIVGQDNLLRREAELELQLPGDAPGSPRLVGNASCVLRVRRWQGPGKVFSSEVLPSITAPEDANLADLQRFSVVVFDGAGGYLRWQHRLRGQHHIVLLSRTDRRLDDAVSALDKAFRFREGDPLTLSSLPAGLEALGFWRAS